MSAATYGMVYTFTLPDGRTVQYSSHELVTVVCLCGGWGWEVETVEPALVRAGNYLCERYQLTMILTV